jgi:hypothetical protein
MPDHKKPTTPPAGKPSRPTPNHERSDSGRYIGDRISSKNDVSNTRPAPDRNTGTGKTNKNG